MLAEFFSLYHYFLTFSGLEKTLESQKEDSQKKLETLESQMTQVTTDLAKMREKEEAEDLGTKLNQLNEELDAKISDAESKLQLLNSSFEQFQTLTNDNQATSQQKIEEVESQINSFKSHSEGTVQDVMGDTENLKVKNKYVSKNFIFFLFLQYTLALGLNASTRNENLKVQQKFKFCV